MPQNLYDISLRATITHQVEIWADSIAEAKEEALSQLRISGEILDVEFERTLYIDPNPD